MCRLPDNPIPQILADIAHPSPVFSSWIHDTLEPIVNLIPPDIRSHLPLLVWEVLIVSALLLLILIPVFRLGKIVFWGKKKHLEPDWDQKYREELDSCPMPVHPPGETGLAVFHVPVRIRLVVAAPVGKSSGIRLHEIPELLDHVMPGLGELVLRQQPRIRIWPAQMSDQGFSNTFARRMIKPDPEGKPSNWILITGRATAGNRTLFIGLGLWSENKTSLGLRNLEPLEWLQVLRLIPPS